ncbi:MAG: rhomboid family intramembrane serine protease [Spirochaetales bacterium]|nr:rhomboid family intramembrane serine protease [Spirochaetales bacterium]
MNLNKRVFPYRTYNLFFLIILINLGVFVASIIAKEHFVNNYIGMNKDALLGLELYRFFSYMFAHGDFQHFLFNMIGLFFFGYYVEEKIGSYSFLFFYIIAGLFSGIISYLFYILVFNQSILLVGASGSVYAVMTAFIVLYADLRINFFGLIRSNVAIIVGLYMLLGLAQQALSSLGRSSDVAIIAHLAGMGFCFLYCFFVLNINPFRAIKKAIDNR